MRSCSFVGGRSPRQLAAGLRGFVHERPHRLRAELRREGWLVGRIRVDIQHRLPLPQEEVDEALRVWGDRSFGDELAELVLHIGGPALGWRALAMARLTRTFSNLRRRVFPRLRSSTRKGSLR